MHNRIPNKFYFINTLKKSNIDKLDHDTGIIFRNYSKKLSIYEIINVKNYCKGKNLKFFLSNNFKLALKLNLDGCYLPAFNNSFEHLNYKTKTSFLIMGSAHNIKEIRQKEAQKVKIIFISSVFKKNKNYLGPYKFNLLSKTTDKKVIALGGISKLNEKKVNLLNCFGMSGISYFE